MQPFLALITPVGDSGSGGGSPPGIWGPLPGFPTNPIPIYPGGTPNPPGIWGPPGPWPSPPISGIPGLPGYPAYPPGFSPGSPPDRPRPTPPVPGWPSVPGGGGNYPGSPGFRPPGTPPTGEGEEEPKFEMKTGWTEHHGWIVVWVPTGPSVTPSSGQQESEQG